MIFPEFNRNKIESLGPNKHFFKGIIKRFTLPKKHKVFVISYGKTGTTSLCHALQELGYRVAGVYSHKITNPNFSNLWHHGKNCLNKYDAFQDMPWCLFYKELYEKYPNGKFIFLTRDSDKWYESLVKHKNVGRSLRNKTFFNTVDIHENPQTVINAYKMHNENVKTFFKGKINQPLFISVKELDWKILCSFLDLRPVYKGLIPYSNKASVRETFSYKLKSWILTKWKK